MVESDSIKWNLLSSERPSKLYMIHVCCRTRATPWDLITSSESSSKAEDVWGLLSEAATLQRGQDAWALPSSAAVLKVPEWQENDTDRKVGKSWIISSLLSISNDLTHFDSLTQTQWFQCLVQIWRAGKIGKWWLRCASSIKPIDSLVRPFRGKIRKRRQRATAPEKWTATELHACVMMYVKMLLDIAIDSVEHC